jgi:hypothetical protein
MNNTTSFEEYLKDLHGAEYIGLDDDMPESFETWLSNQGTDDLIAYADIFAQKKQLAKTSQEKIHEYNLHLFETLGIEQDTETLETADKMLTLFIGETLLTHMPVGKSVQLGEGLPFENSPEIYGNRRIIAYANGWNDCRSQLIKNLMSHE